MRASLLLAIDLSSKPGYARYVDGVLVDCGTRFPTRDYKDAGHYPHNLLIVTQEIVTDLLTLLDRFKAPHVRDIQVVMEETTGGHGYAIKKLEFLHFLINYKLLETGVLVHYVRDGVWKDMVGARQNPAEKSYNAKISRQKKKKKDKFIRDNPTATPDDVPSFRASMINDETGKSKVVKALDPKHYSIRAVREHFGLELTYEQNDMADAINLGYAYLHGAPICDGTDKGGLRNAGGFRIPAGQGRYIKEIA